MTQDMINKIMTRLIFTQKDCTATLRSLVEERFFLCNKTALRLALDDITARAPRDYGSSLTSLRLVATLLLMMVVGVNTAWGQDYSGVYYIGTVNQTDGYYLCPTEDWYYFDTDNNTYTNNSTYSGNPFLTTYKCKNTSGYDVRKAVWIVEKQSNGYYHIKALDGKYLTYNAAFLANKGRVRVHLEDSPNNDDYALFKIEYASASSSYDIISKYAEDNNIDPDKNKPRKYLNINKGNQQDLKGTAAEKVDNINVGGIIGLWTAGSSEQQFTGRFFLEPAAVAKPTITNNFDGTFTITAAEGATIYYTTDGTTPTTATTDTETTSVNVNQTESMTVIKAIAKATSDDFPSLVTTYEIPKCARPVIKVSGGTVTITCATAGATIYYTKDGTPATTSSTPYTVPFAKGDATTIRAIATSPGYIKSAEAIFLPPTEVSSSDDITDMNGNYILADDFTSTRSIGTSENPFMGTIDGGLHSLTLSYPLVANAKDATIKNVILKDVSLSSGTNVGAICNEATGETRIYNCGVLSGSVGGSGKVGGIVGLLDGRSRVINCFNFANITSGSDCGGIVGYNNVASTSGNLQTMVMNCMFYGNITGGNAAPIYGGAIIHNKYASADDTGLNNYCYFLYDEDKNPYVKTIANDNYHGALGAEDRFLNRFELFRMTLNSTRNLAAYYVLGDATQKDEMAKWVLDKSIAPYPILKVPGYYPSIVNPDAEHATTQTERNKGGKLGSLSVTIDGTGSGAQFGAPTGASITTGSLTLNITDKDFDNFNYNYKKVQLPYYNDVGEGNYTGDRVVTGWKISSITGGTPGSFSTDTYDYPSFNFVDRKCTNKDLYSVSGRVFAQGAYWEVPDGVTAITIEPYWAKAVYLSDANYDVTYSITLSGSGSSITATTNKYGVTVCGSSPTTYNEQTVYTTLSDAITNLGSNADHTVYDYAVVLVGNYQQAANDALVNNGNPVTFMSADLDGDNEPDNTLFYYHNMRRSVSPIRFDFLNMPGIGMVKRTYDSSMDPEPGIFAPQGWFEITNTVFVRFGQFEYAGSDSFKKTILAPLILQGGIYEQFVSCTRTNAQNTNYLLVGGNAWFKNFANGCHTAKAQKTPKVPINVTGGDYTNFYLTGIYQPDSNEDNGNAECYIDGGRFSEVAGAGMQQVKGNVTWLINAADITSFYGGGINAAKPITGSISTTISNSYVDEFYGGPKFGDMAENKTVTTNATDCYFGKFFGAGYGGTAFNRVNPGVDNSTSDNTRNWANWVNTYYKREYSAGNGGISTNYDYEFISHSDGSQTVARFFVNYASLSLASTRNVTSTLSGCTIGTFYGGGSLGAVNGNINSTLTDCTVTGNAFGAGFSASVPTVEVWNTGAYLTPNPTYNRTANVFNNASVKTPKDNNQYIVYTWSDSHGSNEKPFTDTANGKHYIYTNVSLDGLGAVSGDVTLNIEGTTSVGGSVYGGGEESAVEGNTEVNVTGGTIGVANAPAYGDLVGNVYGGGRGKADDKLAGLVKGNTQVTISGTAESPFIYHNVYGGGAYGSVGDFTYDNTGMPTALNTENTGECNVTITGGKIGTNGQNNGMVFGSSRGNVAAPGAGGIDPNDSLAWVYDTHVIIGESGGDTSKPLIRGSVYGSGENGHTLHNTDVKVHSGTIGIAEGEEITYNGIKYSGPRYIFRGNVYGGGCGTDTYDTKDDQNITKTYYNFNAGIVKGNTSVTIDGGHVIHDVYGGGSMGSVGTFTFNDDATDNIKDGKPVSCTEGTGTCNVTISGGMIGTTGMQMTAGGGPDDYGHVFGAGRGETKDSIDYPNVVICAYFNKTNVTINNSAFVMGSVYGGSESGHVLNDTKVTIAGGQIGCGEGKEAAYTEEEWAAESPSTLKPTSHWDYVDDGAPYDQYADELGNYTGSGESAEGGNKRATDGHTFYGNVFGGGSGYYPYAPKKWLFSAGRVEGKSEVVITGGHILNNVYGGCEMSDVYRNASITMSGGTVGVPRSKGDIKLKPTIGHIYGAGMGDKRIFFNTVTNVASTTVNIYGGKVYGSVHGGGEDGHVLGNTQTTISGDVEIGSVKNGETSGFDGNVFGGGQGSPTALTAGTIGGNVELNIKGGTMYGSVYGGGRIASVGPSFVAATDDDYGKMQEGDDHGCIVVNLTGGTIEQNVFGGCMGTRGHAAVDQVRFAVSKNITVNLNEGVDDDAKGCVVKGSIFGCNNVNSSPQGQVKVHIYKTQNALASQIAGTVSEGVEPKVKGRYDVKAVYGGGNMAAYLPKGPTDPNDDYNGKNTTFKTQVIIDGCEQTSIQQVYGGGNAASTPATDVTVNGCYEIEELFGGGNGDTKITYDEGTTWLPNPGANVGFYNYSEYYKEDGVEKIKDADNADTPENRDKNYGYGTGEAAVNVLGGHIHRVFGGSNTKGNVRKTALTLLEELLKEDGETPCCPFNVEEAYGGGKSAPMDADTKLLMQCIPGLKAVYGGAEAANIQGDVTLNITNGTFDRVFGGNNKSGTISGSITVNIEEVGCRPIIIGELYGGGNLAGYSVYGYNTDGSLKETGSHWDHPQVNVKSFTSIGSVYGGGYGTTATMVGNPTVNINVAMGDKASASAAVIGQDGDNWKDMAVKDAQVVDKSTVGSYPIPYHKSGQIGAISQVFGGGNAAPVKGDTEVNIGTTIGEYEYLPVVIKVGDTFPTLPEGEKYYTRSGTAPDYTYTETTDTTAQADTDYYRKYEIKGVDIRGNVYGGGNNAEVTGNTNVNIGKKKTE